MIDKIKELTNTFNRTYKELKLHKLAGTQVMTVAFNRTYKELKRKYTM